MKNRAVVFGIFNGVHDGHRDLFRQAKELADELVVIVGRDSIAQQLKGKKPKYSESERIEILKQEELVDNAVLGDDQISTYKILQELHPDVICVGYDQETLEADLKKWVGDRNIKIYRAKPYKKNTLHSSLLS